MTFARTGIQDFSTANKIYANSVVTFYTVDESTGQKTSTKATLYRNLIGSETLQNPQTLDSYGKLKNPAYIEQPVIATITGLGNAPDHDTGVIQLSETASVSANTVLALGGLVARTNAERASETMDIMDFGAVGDGTTDDGVAIQAAINWASAANNRALKVSHWHAYSQRVDRDIGRSANRRAGFEIPSNGNLALVGIGGDKCGFIAKVANPGYGAFWIQGGTTVYLADFGIDGRASAFNGYARAINGHGITRFRADGLHISNSGGAMIDFEAQIVDDDGNSISPVRSEDMQVSGCRLYNGYNLGIGTKLGGANRLIVTNNLFKFNSNGGCVSFEGEEEGGTNGTLVYADQCVVTGNIFTDIGDNAVSQGSSIFVTEKVRNVTIAGNSFYNNRGQTGACIHVGSSPSQTDSDVSKVVISGNVIDFSNIGIDINNGNATVDSIVISGNTITRSGHGVRLFYNYSSGDTGIIKKLNITNNIIDACIWGINSFAALDDLIQQVRVSDNIITDITNNAVKMISKRAQIVDNYIADCGAEGVWMNGSASMNSDNSNLSGNTIMRCSAGIRVSNSLYCHITNNHILDCTSAAIWLRGDSRTVRGHFIDGNSARGCGGFALLLQFHRDINVTRNNDFQQNFSGVTDQNTKFSHTGTPTTGSYVVGDIVWDRDVASGGSIGLVCTTAGTLGTLSAVTADTVNGSANITVSSAANIEVGMYLTVTAAGISASRVKAVSGTTVTVSNNATSDQTATAVAYSAPVFKSFGTVA